MGIIETCLHFLTPRHTNNFKARMLHASAISTYLVLLLVFQIFLTGVARFRPEVLGYASDINVNDLLKYTNEQRIKNGVSLLVLNQQLSSASQLKARDMFANQYWAHTSPQGKNPWSFINDTGYTYLFAGENLARDFGDSRSVVEAWMNSTTHRENLFNPRYQDIGFAVVNGKYNGHETTLVVQMFGATSNTRPAEEVTNISSSAGIILNTEAGGPPFKLDVFSLTKKVSLGLTVVLIGVLLVDSVLVYRRRAVRISGHNFAHILFLIAALVALNLIGRVGLIL